MSLTLNIKFVKGPPETGTETDDAPSEQTNTPTISMNTPITIYNPPEAINANEKTNTMIMVTILTPTGQATAIKISRKASISHLQHIWPRVRPCDVKVEGCTFYFGGRLLEGAMRLEECGVEDGDTILVGRTIWERKDVEGL